MLLRAKLFLGCQVQFEVHWLLSSCTNHNQTFSLDVQHVLLWRMLQGNFLRTKFLTSTLAQPLTTPYPNPNPNIKPTYNPYPTIHFWHKCNKAWSNRRRSLDAKWTKNEVSNVKTVSPPALHDCRMNIPYIAKCCSMCIQSGHSDTTTITSF